MVARYSVVATSVPACGSLCTASKRRDDEEDGEMRRCCCSALLVAGARITIVPTVGCRRQLPAELDYFEAYLRPRLHRKIEGNNDDANVRW